MPKKSPLAKYAKKPYLLIALALVAVGGVALFLWARRAPIVSEPDYATAGGATGLGPAYTGAPVDEGLPKESTKLAGAGEFQYV